MYQLIKRQRVASESRRSLLSRVHTLRLSGHQRLQHHLGSPLEPLTELVVPRLELPCVPPRLPLPRCPCIAVISR
jgi:hypothetical protein